MKDPALAAFEAWFAAWWKNTVSPDPVTRSNVREAFLAGWDAGRRRRRA